MCGIIGGISTANIIPQLLQALERLEYRGYDSMGLATVGAGGLQRRRSVGKFAQLQQMVEAQPLSGTIGVGHTRWATHGVVSEANAHPHSDGHVAVVHNGIIENFQTLKNTLMAQGVVFESETDTEVVVHLISQALRSGKTLEQAATQVLPQLEGAFALVILSQSFPDKMVVARRGKSPLAVGLGADGSSVYAGSDAIALAGLAQQIAYLEDGDWGVLQRGAIVLKTLDGGPVERPFIPNPIQPDALNHHRRLCFCVQIGNPGPCGGRGARVWCACCRA